MARVGNGTTAKIVQTTASGTIIMQHYTWHFFYKGVAAPSAATTSQPFCVSAPGANSDATKLQIGFSWNHSSAAFQQAAFMRVNTTTFAAAKITSALTGGVWYAIGATWDGTNLQVYLNGQLQATTAAASCQNDGSTSFLTSALIGAGQTGNFAPGAIAEVGWTFGAADASAMAALASGAPWVHVMQTLSGFGQETPLYWPLLGDSPEPDYGGNHRAGTVTAATVANHPGVQSLVAVP